LLLIVTVFRLWAVRARERLFALPICSFATFSGTQEASCVTDLLVWTIFGHGRGFLRYRFVRLRRFQARKRLLALPICSFGQFSETQEASCVTDLFVCDVFGHARGFLRYRFARLDSFRARERLLALPICSFGQFSGTQETSCVTDLLVWDVFGHVRDFLCYRFARLGRFRARKNILRTRFYLFDPLHVREPHLQTRFSLIDPLSRLRELHYYPLNSYRFLAIQLYKVIIIPLLLAHLCYENQHGALTEPFL
jgi:hypothetical protein